MSDVRDVILVVLLVFFTGLIFVVIQFSSKVMVARITTLPAVNNSNTQPAYQAFLDIEKSIDRLDYVNLCLFIGLILGIVISGYFVGGNPAFQVIYFIVLGIGVIFSMVLANVWHTATELSIWGQILPSYSVAASFPITTHLMTYAPMYMVVIGIIGSIAMFSRPSVSQL